MTVPSEIHVHIDVPCPRYIRVGTLELSCERTHRLPHKPHWSHRARHAMEGGAELIVSWKSDVERYELQ